MTSFTGTVLRFLGDRSGAVTVEWAVVTGMIVGLGLIVALAFSQGLGSATSGIETELSGTSEHIE